MKGLTIYALFHFLISLAPPIPICQEHHKHMEYFCKTDDQLVCGDCLVLSRHRGHSTSLAKDELETEMDYLRHHSFEDAEKMLLKVREAVDNVSNMTTSLKEKGERTKLQIQKHFKEIRDALESRELALLSTTEDIVIRKVSKLERQKEVLVQSRDQLDIEVRICILLHYRIDCIRELCSIQWIYAIFFHL